MTEWVQRREKGGERPELWMEGWIGVEHGGGERMKYLQEMR